MQRVQLCGADSRAGGRRPGVGVDLLMVETMMSLAEAGEAIRAAREVAPGLRLVVMMTVDEDGNCLDGASAETAAARLTELGADAIGCNCSYGPASVLRAIERMRGATPCLWRRCRTRACRGEGRSIYPVSPEEMASFARRVVRGGCELWSADAAARRRSTSRAIKAASCQESARRSRLIASSGTHCLSTVASIFRLTSLPSA